MKKTLLAVLCLALIAASAFVTGTVIDSSPSVEATVADSYEECFNSYIQCLQDCNFYPEPTRSQCKAWCRQTHWCANV